MIYKIVIARPVSAKVARQERFGKLVSKVLRYLTFRG